MRMLTERFSVLWRFYRSPKFMLTDCLSLLQYAINNPFLLCSNYNALFPKTETQCYGETPLTTLNLIARRVGVTQSDVVYELGCGRGRSAFWLHLFTGCRVIGIDINPVFIKRAERVRRWLSFERVSFIQSFMHSTDFSDATVIYLYGTCLHDSYIERLTTHFSGLKPGTRVITVSFPLTNYGGKKYFETEKQFTARFPWGSAEVFVQRKRNVN